jgi:hypothetical protein
VSRGFIVDEDNLHILGDRLITLGGFLDGGTEQGTGGVRSSDFTDLSDAIDDESLGAAARQPWRAMSDQSLAAGAVPTRPFADFVENWETVRVELASDIRAVGAILQRAGRGYTDRDQDLTFHITPPETPSATPVTGTPNLTG